MAETTWPAGGGRTNKVSEDSEEPPSGSGLLSRLQAVLWRTGRNGGSGDGVEELIGQELEHRKVFSREEMLMLSRLLAFGRHRVEDAMVPRADIIAVEASTPLDELVRCFHKAAHSRLPVYRETLDDPVGMVHIKDVLPYLAVPEPGEGSPIEEPGEGEFSLSRIVRDVLFVPPSMPAADLLVKMQTTRVHMALVIDEYGGTDGLATIEDLVELIVGDIEDEHDVEESPQIIPCDDGSYIADARLELDDLAEALGSDLVSESVDDDIDTLGGLVFSVVGRIPQRGEIVSHPAGIEFEVIDADPRRIKRLRIRRAVAKRRDPKESKSAPPVSGRTQEEDGDEARLPGVKGDGETS